MRIKEETVSIQSEYRRKTDAEIRALALGVQAGTVFGTWMLPDEDQRLLPTIFMPLMGLDDLHRKKILRDGVVHLWGDMRDAVQHSINGYPIFTKMGFLDREDAGRIACALKALEVFLVSGDDVQDADA